MEHAFLPDAKTHTCCRLTIQLRGTVIVAYPSETRKRDHLFFRSCCQMHKNRPPGNPAGGSFYSQLSGFQGKSQVAGGVSASREQIRLHVIYDSGRIGDQEIIQGCCVDPPVIISQRDAARFPHLVGVQLE